MPVTAARLSKCYRGRGEV